VLLRSAYCTEDCAEVGAGLRLQQRRRGHVRRGLLIVAGLVVAAGAWRFPVLGAGLAAMAAISAQLHVRRGARERQELPSPYGWPQAAVTDHELPDYTVIVPLRRLSAAAIRRCIASLASLDYPPHKLEGLAIVGEEDQMTLSALRDVRCPPWLQIVRAPAPRPSRRWLSVYGLRVARGQLATVVDARAPLAGDDLRYAAVALLAGGQRFASLNGTLKDLPALSDALDRAAHPRVPLVRRVRAIESVHVDLAAARAALGWPGHGGGPHVPGSVWVCLPTYNEAVQVEAVVDAVLGALASASIDATVLVIDDASPDGTGAIADRLAAADDRVRVLHRPRKDGIGPAYRAGFRTALAGGADLVVEMDCDFSHDPARLPALLAAAHDAHVVLGSRYVPGGRVQGWSLSRRLISRGGCAYARRILGVSVRDLTGGFKVFRREVLEALPIDDVTIRGYGFQVEMTYRALVAGFQVAEVPITFNERRAGRSKMSGAIACEAALAVPRMRRLRAGGHPPRPVTPLEPRVERDRTLVGVGV
jgi:dolichol-phosphate mannosyltransferase